MNRAGQLREDYCYLAAVPPRACGCGLEAVAAAGQRLPLLPVVARTRPANEAAIRVAFAAGLQRRPDLDCDG